MERGSRHNIPVRVSLLTQFDVEGDTLNRVRSLDGRTYSPNFRMRRTRLKEVWHFSRLGSLHWTIFRTSRCF